MPEVRVRKSARRHAALALLAPALACALTLLARPAPAAAAGLHTSSPPEVLNDPVVKRCRVLAARRMDPNGDSVSTAVETAAMMFNLEPVFDAVAACRAALAIYPNEPKVIVPHATASDTLSLLALGLKFPDSEAKQLALALETVKTEAPSGIVGRTLGFFLGSAYEYGVGAEHDRAAALKWYAFAADAGDPIAKRELARLQGNK